MRKPKYLSNSSLSQFEQDREEWYLRHAAPTRATRLPQERPMAIGSAFDAYAKNHLFECVYGVGADPDFEFDAIFEQQVEPQNRDWAREHGKYVFDCYFKSGALEELLELFSDADEPPRFEFTAERVVGGVPLLGKPDCRFVAKGGVHLILDWKVRGYCSRHATSPSKDYMLCRDGFDANALGVKPSRGAGQPHKNFIPYDHHGVTIHAGFMEYSNSGYADQLAVYSWLMGEEVGDEAVVVGIDEIVAKPHEPHPLLRVAQHRSRVSAEYQRKLLHRAQTAWAAIQSGHIFHELPREESDRRCVELNDMAVGLHGDNSGLENWFNETVRSGYRNGIGYEAEIATRRR